MMILRRREQAPPSFHWIGLITLVITLTIFIEQHITFLLLLGPILLIILIRHLDWKNIVIAVILLSTTLYPVRILSEWSLNPILYTVIALGCFGTATHIFRKYRWKNGVAALLLVCGLLSGWQVNVSASEVGQCGIEDWRWNALYHCSSTNMNYQQIECYPIAIRGWCWACISYHCKRPQSLN